MGEHEDANHCVTFPTSLSTRCSSTAACCDIVLLLLLLLLLCCSSINRSSSSSSSAASSVKIAVLYEVVSSGWDPC